MARLLQQIISPAESCHYLPGRASTTDSRVMVDVSPAELEELLAQGWRRFGPVYFRPICPACGECVSVRVPVADFVASDNQKRVVRRAARLRVEIGRPRLDDRRLALHQRWHEVREEARGWEPGELDRESYALQFCFPHPSAREFTYWDGDLLVGVGIADQTPAALSAVYFYFDPDHGALSPGTFNVLTCLRHAREQGLSHVYLGYRVEGCASLRYKGRFQPLEKLEGRPAPGEPPRWLR